LNLPYQKLPVYLIDDDESFRTVLHQLLEFTGYDIRSFSSATEFFETTNPSDRGLIITDLKMPGMTGLDFLRMLSSKKYGMKAIVVTGYDDTQSRKASEELGVVAFFRKPIDDPGYYRRNRIGYFFHDILRLFERFHSLHGKAFQ